MTESEANKALEALDAFDDLIRRADHDANVVRLGNVHPACLRHDHIKTIRAALTRLSELEPIIQELVEARKKATRGPWIARHNVENGTMHSWDIMQEDFAPTDKHEFPQRICESVRGTRFPKPSPDCDFIALAANRIAKIGGGG